MSWRTLLVLALAVAGLAWFALRTEHEADAARADLDVVVFPGLDENLVHVVRVENVMRDLHLCFERDPGGAWRLTDPVEARAESGTVDPIVAAAVRARGPVVPAAEALAPEKLGLEPPRFVLDVDAGAPAARARRRVELGAPDLDGVHMFARVDGRIVRISRELEPLVSRELHEFRASSITDVDPRLVVEVRRRGSVPIEGTGPAPDASFDAVLEGGAWRVTSPVAGLLDPAAITLYVRSIAGFRHEGEFDEGARPLAALGLDPPEITITLGTAGSLDVEVLLGRSGPDRRGGWLGTRRGSGVVWEISGPDAQVFALPLAELLDHRIVRARRSSVRALEIEHPAASVRLERAGKVWTCAFARPPGAARTLPEPAESRAVEDLLGALERYELAQFLPLATFDAGDAPVRFRVEADDGATAATFGAVVVDADGVPRIAFQREGETAMALGDPAILEPLRRDPELFLSLLPAQTDESGLGAVVLRGARGERRFERASNGIWTRAGAREEARELRGVLDALLFVRVARRVPAAERAPLEDAIEVELVGLDAQRGGTGAVVLRFAIGLAGGRAEIDASGRRGVALDTTLHAKLAALLAGS